jgi:hypothetical protein
LPGFFIRSPALFVGRENNPMVTVVCSTFKKLADGSYQLDMEDGTQKIFANIADVRDYGAGDESPELAIRALLGNWLDKEPMGDNPNLVNGLACDYELISAKPIYVR